MKPLKIELNFRQPNTDRVFEVIMAAQVLGIEIPVSKIPHPYERIVPHYDVEKLDATTGKLIPPYVLIWSNHPHRITPELQFYGYETIKGRNWEPWEAVCNRAKSVKPTAADVLTDPAAKSIFKTAVEKLNLKFDSCELVVNLAWVIACMSESDSILAEHIAEAIQYVSDDEFHYIADEK